MQSKTNKSSDGKSLSLYRRGDFLCAYGRDAEIVAEVLDLTITTERRSARQPLKMTGFPEAMIDSFTRQITSAGYRLAVIDTQETAK